MNSKKSFNSGIVVLVAIVVYLLLINIFDTRNYFVSLIVGLLVLLVGITSIFGVVKAF